MTYHVLKLDVSTSSLNLSLIYTYNKYMRHVHGTGHYKMDEFEDMMNVLSELNAHDPNGYNATLDVFNNLRYTHI